jgi:HSP20 family protein
MQIMIRRKDKKTEIVPKEYWTPSTNPMALLHDMDRLFDDFKMEWESAFLPSTRLMADTIRQPLLDMADNGKEYVITAELPGITKEDLNVQVTENSIEISSEKKTVEKEEKEGYIRRERHYSNFYRSIPLPDSILPGKADAELKEGILTVKLPKAKPEERKGKKLPVK